MKIAHLTLALSLATAAACTTTERVLSPERAAPYVVTTVAPALAQVPLLFVVDGVRLQRDQVPSLTSDQIAAVKVLKGHAALSQYGPDASYGVVVITTKSSAAPGS
jgi:TonB-dependent SusC/RagA subfamily outer membrane receptor